MKVLWAPWRMTLICAPKRKGCIFCELPRKGDARDNLVLAVTSRSVVMLNRYPYSNAHLLIAPRRHVAQLDRLGVAERRDLDDTLRASIGILRRNLRPEGMNVGMNLGEVAGAGIADHLHWHVVPRWKGDTNFMPVLGSVRVIPQHLLESYDSLSPSFSVIRRRSPPVAAGRRRR